MGNYEEEDESSDEDEDDESPSATKKAAPKKKSGKEEEKKDEPATEEGTDKNWSSVNLVFQESKLSFRAGLSELNFSNWIWSEVIRPKLDESKGNLR